MLSSYKREDLFKNLVKQELDVLVIGGGITGAGIALDAAARGLNVGLVEMQDFAAGTSSRSTKLIHGGLRYLKQFEVGIVAEVGKERAIVYENGPHVTTPEWMMLPFYKGGIFGPFTTNIGLLVYDFLAKVKKEERRKMLKADEALKKEPLLKRENLLGAGFYVEYKTDDARLTIEVLKKAVEYGVSPINYAKVTEFLYEDGRVYGAVIEDQITNKTYTVHAKKIINAAGPWVDGLRSMDNSLTGKSLHLTKGVHLVFSREKFPLKQAIYFEASDGRMVFAIPRGRSTYVGTTDTTYKGDISHPTMTVADRDYLLDAINFIFPSLKLSASDVESSYAGLRPLIAGKGKNPSDISRKDEIFISDTGLISIAGGKLTGYRKMAEQVVNIVAKQLSEEDGFQYTKSVTLHIPISGGDVGGSVGFQEFREQKCANLVKLGINASTANYFIDRYGSNIDKVIEIYLEKKDLAEEVGVDPVVFAALNYAIEFELAYKPSDFFIRRTGGLYFNIDWVRLHKDSVINYMASAFHWTDEQKQEYICELDMLLHEATNPVG